MNFHSIVNNIISSINPNTNIVCTENLDKAYNTTGSKCLDFFTRITRNAPISDYAIAFFSAFQENNNMAIQILLNMRDIRGGKGEKLIPIVIMVCLKNTISTDNYKLILTKFIEYGCWKDLLKIIEIHNRIQLELNPLLDPKLLDNSVEFDMFANQLNTDYNAILSSPNKKVGISLCAKWAPSEKTHYNKHPVFGMKHISKTMSISPKEYRMRISKLREHLNILERLMSSGNENQIDFSKIPAIAMKKMKNSFNRDTNSEGITSDSRVELHKSYTQYLTDLTAGKTKVNIKGIQPHELVSTYLRNDVPPDQLVEAQWSTLVAKTKESGIFKNTIAIVDTSGSMDGEPLHVAVALGLLVSECTESSEQKIMTFSDNPRWHKIEGSNLQQKVKSIDYKDWGMSTNLRKAFELILEDAKTNKLSPDQIISTLMIFTDMQFNSVNGNQKWESTFETVQKAFMNAGYPFPKIVCWNLRTSSAKTLPVSQDEPGYVMLSGFSSELLKHVLNGEEFTPLTMLLHVLEPYDIVLQDSNVTDRPFSLDQLQKAITDSAFKKAFKKDPNDKTARRRTK
jgi:hypothetical protein